MMVIKGRGQCFLRTEMIKKIDLQDKNNLSHYIDKDNQGWISLVHSLSLSLTPISLKILLLLQLVDKRVISSNMVAFPCYQPENREFSKHLWWFF